MLPYKGNNDINILHSWLCLVFWLHDVCPQMDPGHGVTLIQRLKNALVAQRDDVVLEDIPEEYQDCQKVISEFMEVYLRHPGMLYYFKAIGPFD
jgi:hypothetical protein